MTAIADTEPAANGLRTPYTIVIDTREQLAYTFARPLSGRRPRETYSIVKQTGTLATGDYSLFGYESRVAVERKSHADFFGTLGGGRDRFVRELERLNAMDFAAVVVESEWSTILTNPPVHSRLHPRSIIGSVVAWNVRYPRVAWMFLPGRDVAEAWTARVLDRWWKEHIEG